MSEAIKTTGMRARRGWSALLALASAAGLSGVMSSDVQAAPCAAGPYSGYTVAGFSCEVDGASFSNFSFFLQASGAGNVLTTDDIIVSPVTGVDTVGLRFSGDFSATGAANGVGPAEGIRINAYRFFYDVTRPGSVFTDIGVELTNPSRFAPNPLKFGGIQGFNLAANDAALAIADDLGGGLLDFTALNADRLVVMSDNTLQLAGGASAAGTALPVGFAEVDAVDFLYVYRVEEVPTPASLLLLGTGLIALGLGGRKGANCAGSQTSG